MLYPRAEIGAWIRANAPQYYVPGGPITLVAMPNDMCEIVAWPQDLPRPTLEQLPTVSPVTDVNSPIPSILKSYDESEASRGEAIKLLKSTAAYALGAKIGADLARANPPKDAEGLAALKAEAKTQASLLGGRFFDRYFGWIGAYREGGGPGFLEVVRSDTDTEFLRWPLPGGGITLPDGTVVAPSGGIVLDLFEHFLT